MRLIQKTIIILLMTLCSLTTIPTSSASEEASILDFIPAFIHPYPNPVRSKLDITYYQNEDPERKHQLDIYYSPKFKDQKVIFFVHGGAWRSGDKNTYGELGKTLAGFYGFTVVNINYELSNPDDGDAKHPDHIEDVARAFCWIKDNISPYGDPDKIYIFGQSAGAHLVTLLATNPEYIVEAGCSQSDIKAVIAYSGSYQLEDLTIVNDNPLGLSSSTAGQYLLLFNTIFPEPPVSAYELRQASPEIFISADQPPFLIVDVVQDMPGFMKEAENFVLACNGLSPAPVVEYQTLVRDDFSDATWAKAEELAVEQGGLFADAVGHYAEMVSINTKESDSRAATLLVDFVNSN